MDEELGFLRAIHSHPDDEALRLIYADWLQERGDPRAEYLRLEVELHGPAKGDKARMETLQEQVQEYFPTLDTCWVARMQRTRFVTPGTRLELVSVCEGKGLIEVRGGNEDTVLLVEGKPVALNWNDYAGSVG